jgi:hypothetical protein
MPLRYLLDENLRGYLWQAIQSHNARQLDFIDATRVGDATEVSLQSPDPLILLSTEETGRILVSRDKRTLPLHLRAHLDAHHHSPGIFVVRRSSSISAVVWYLAAAAYASEPSEWQDAIHYIP